MSEPLPFMDPEEGLRALLLANFPNLDEINVGNFPTTGLAQKLPYVSVELQGGLQTYFEDEPLIDLDFFATTKDGAKNLAAEVLASLLDSHRTVVVGSRRFTIDTVGVIRRPVKEPWDDEKIRRQSAIIQISIRR